MVSPHILAVVQSDLQYICSLRASLEDNGFPSFTVARNSQEAILYLRGIGIYQDRFRYPLPRVLILDSQNPDGSDLEVLGWVRDWRGFANLPVIILCQEQHSQAHVTCMLDPAAFLVDRSNRTELVDALRNTASPGTILA